MFTGIVQDLVSIRSVVDESDLKRLGLALGGLASGLNSGASVAVNGTCLTVTGVDRGVVYFDVITETLRTTTLGMVCEGDLVNVERSFQIGDEVGGHIVSGHVTATAELVERSVSGNDHVLTFDFAEQWMKYVFHKGFIALDGASLTVSSVNRPLHRFSISLIPETLQRTTLGLICKGDRVNVEVDAQTVTTVDTVERLFSDAHWRAEVFSGGVVE